MTQQDQDKIIDRIRKLLKHANDNASGAEAERDTAMRMAMKLLAMHNLSMSQVEMEDKEDRDQTFIEEFPDPFRRVVAEAIAKLFFCKFYSGQVPNKQKRYFYFVGLESNATTAAEMTSWLLKSIYSESQRAQKANGNAHGFGTTFRNAVAIRISERCDAIRSEAEQEDVAAREAAEQAGTSDATALALSTLYANEQAANESYIKDILKIELKTKNSTLHKKSKKADEMGREFGDKVNLNKQIPTTPKADDSAAPVVLIGN